jgi:hypothetical protein
MAAIPAIIVAFGAVVRRLVAFPISQSRRFLDVAIFKLHRLGIIAVVPSTVNIWIQAPLSSTGIFAAIASIKPALPSVVNPSIALPIFLGIYYTHVLI